MNSFENNTPLPTELHPGADRAMDGLLQELANNNIADDEAFLSELESALDQASGTPKVQPIAVRSTSQRWWKWGLLGSAAACAVGMLAWRDSQLKQLAKNKSDQPHEAASPSAETIPNELLFEVIQNRFATLDEVVASYEKISGIQLLRSINLTGNIWMPRAKTAPDKLRKEDAVAYYNGAILANGFSLHEYSPTLSTLTYDRSVFSSADCSPANVQAAYDERQNSLAKAEAGPSIAEKIVRTGRIEPIQKLETEADQLMTEGNYEGAIEKFQTALSGLPEAPMSAKLRAVLIAKFSNACIRQADKLGKLARIDDAKAVLNRVLVASVDPTNASARTLLKRLGDPDYYNAAMTEGHYRGMNESTTDFATRRRDHYVAPNLQAPAPSIDKSLPEIPDGAGTTSSYAISGFSMPAAGGIGGAEGGLRGSGRGVAGGGGIGTGAGPGIGDGYGLTNSGAGTLTLSGSTQGGLERNKGVGPGSGMGFVDINGLRAYYREANPSDPVSNGEKYSSVMENAFLSPLKAPLSTFSVDVDTASYANLRRMIQSGQNVPPAAVRIEEMVNYFTYSYPQPDGPHPFSVQVESAACPWNEAHRLVKIGLKAKEIAREKRPSANLVFLCDVSGSMNSGDKLPLLVQNLTVLTNELNADDTVGIVVYAGSEGVALPPTSGGDKQTILRALTQLSAGGSTNGGAGINRAYQMAQERFIKGGINRVVLCTDGDFNVGTTSKEALVNLVEEKAKGGVFLTVCGYGQGNLNDSMMEAITNKGNGVYHYVDSEKEGKKIFKDELFGTLMTVAKDVKLQVEFNPAKVGQYRLVGYDNRMLKKEDFANDKVDAGDIGAGHTVTALYEIVPPGVPAADKPVENLKYQQSQPVVNEAPPAIVDNNLPEMLTVKLRYKEPEGTESKLLEVPHTDAGQPLAAASSDFKFASAVAEFGEWIRGKRVAGRSPLQMAEQAESARGNDPHGLRGEFIELVKKAGAQRQ